MRVKFTKSAILSVMLFSFVRADADILPSWHESAAKQNIVSFVESISDKANDDFVPEAERIAVFDNDGTLWSERPVYFQLLFAIDRVKALAGDHPEWKSTQPFQAVLEDDMDGLAAAGENGLMQLIMATHAGLTTDEFREIVKDWLATARHPACTLRLR